MLILSQVGYAWIRPFLIVLSPKQNIFDHLWCYQVQNGYSFSGRDQDVVIEFRNHVIFHDWAHFRGRALPLKSGGCKILRWWGYHHQIWATIYGYGWWYDEEDIITKYGAMGRAMRWRKEDIIYSHRSEFAISSLLWIDSLSSFIRNKQLTSYFSFQELSRYDLLHRAIIYHINTQRGFKMFDMPTEWVNHH